MVRLSFAWALVSLLLFGCDPDGDKKGKSAPPPQANTSAVPAGDPLDDKVGAPDGLTEDRLRALVHAPGVVDRDQFFRLLGGDAAARRWAPLALGLSCDDENATETEHRLLNATAAWLAAPRLPTAAELRTVGWAIGACASPTAEDVLRGWLSPEPAAEKSGLLEAGVFGLGALADRKGTLSERTQTTLLDVAAREGQSELMQPLGRIGRLSEAVGAHILEVTGSLLTRKERPGSRHALFALGSAGPSAEGPLFQVLMSGNFSPSERAAAAQSLSRLGEVGQESLDKSLRDLLKRGLPTSYDRELWIPLRAILNHLRRAETSKPELATLGSIVLPEGTEREKVAQKRRLVWLRCQAARLLAGSNFEATTLLGCDPEKGRDFRLAQLEVLGREPLQGKRKTVYLELLKSDDPVVVQAALRLLAAHPEVENTAELLQNALEAKVPGTQATSAQLIAAYPGRAHDKSDDEGPREGLVLALKSLLDPKNTEVASEARAAAISAAGAVRALSLKPEIEALCAGKAQAMWSPAQGALALLGSPNAKCPRTALEASPQAETSQKPVTLVADTDVGELLLHVDGLSAPHSARHFLEMVDAKYYDGIAVHGQRAGFAVQFGDKDGDGYQDRPSVDLPHEVSPTPFDAGSFGMSAFSPGSQDTQIFVVVSDAPQLYGTRVHLGRVEGPFHLLVVGDVIHSLRRK